MEEANGGSAWNQVGGSNTGVKPRLDGQRATHLHRHLQGAGFPRDPHRQALVNLAESPVTEAPADTHTHICNR